MLVSGTLTIAAAATGTTPTGTFVATAYTVNSEASWVTAFGIENKTATQFTVTFATPAPPGGGTYSYTAFSASGTVAGATARRTLSALRTAVRDNVDESTASFWSNAQLNRFINRAKDRVWTEVRKLKEDYFLTTRSSTDGSLVIFGDLYAASSFKILGDGTTLTYSLPPDFAEMKLIEVITSGQEHVAFQHCDMASPAFRTARSLTTSLAPDVILFDIVGERTLTLANRSDTALDLRINYIPIVPDMADDTDLLEMPHALYMSVEEFATAAALKMDRDPNSAAWEATGNASVARALGAAARQTQDPEFVRGFLDE